MAAKLILGNSYFISDHLSDQSLQVVELRVWIPGKTNYRIGSIKLNSIKPVHYTKTYYITFNEY